jgi:hypothetical protein
MYDAIYVGNLPGGDVAYGAYVGGKWPTYNAVRVAFPHARVLSIAVNAGQDADCLDIEPGDATADQAPAWVRRQQARGVARPVLYTSQTNLGAVLAALAAAGVGRGEVRLWSAHYAGKHICSPACGAPVQCDGTQWIDHDDKYDESLLADDFFAPAPTATGGLDMAIELTDIANLLRDTLRMEGISGVAGQCAAALRSEGVSGAAVLAAKAAAAADPKAIAAEIAPLLTAQGHALDETTIEQALRNVFATLGQPAATPGA